MPTPELELIDELLELLANKTRRRILELLSKEPLYITKLINTLHAHPQDVVRQLKRLEQRGFVRSYERASLSGPPRKYYIITNAMSANVVIGPNKFSLNLFSGPKGQKKYGSSPSTSDISNIPSEALNDAFKLVLSVLYQKNPTNDIKTTVTVLESLKKSLTEDII